VGPGLNFMEVKVYPVMQTLFTIKSGALAFAVAAMIATPSVAQSIAFEGATADLMQITAKVDAVDKKDRLITMTGPQGNTVVVEAGPKVKNFDRIKAGDDIVASYCRRCHTVSRSAGNGGRRLCRV
jgi:ammonia channel protein AmtB